MTSSRQRGYRVGVPDIAAVQVRLIAWTQFAPPDDVDWHPDADGGQALVEFAGRACYESWHKPNPATATNAGFLRHLLHVGHLSAFEHSTATFYLTGLSHTCGHELMRHRHFSYSQLSPRSVPADGGPVVEPAMIAADPQLHAQFVAATSAGLRAYRELLANLEQRLAATGGGEVARKQARQATRTVLPGATETRLVMTGNYRAWRHLVAARATEAADPELRQVAVACLRQLREIAPHAFDDFTISTLVDGTEIAASALSWES